MYLLTPLFSKILGAGNYCAAALLDLRTVALTGAQ